MSRALRCCAALAIVCCASATAQQIRTYTEAAGAPDAFVYGLPVPLPIESLTPVDGFRSYASLEARLQSLALVSSDLSAHDIGRSTANRVQWAYVAGDENDVDVEGRPEAAFFINATTHAREWAAPEVATGTLERLVAGANDAGLVRYLLDNTSVVVIPVHNVDGFLQTQRYPTQAILGKDPDYPSDWPRDGRMRRKNMPGVDEVLTTFDDHLRGVDLNRNHPPLWATNVSASGSSANPDSLTYHGSGPHSEAENLSLERAAALGPVTRLRLGIDVHTFSKVFYSSNTGRARLNAIQANLIERLRMHHVQVSGGKNYRDVPDPPGQGIGAAAEYFAYQWLVPAWTIELEPTSSAVEYGGTNVTHSGFILPAAEIRRVREAWAQTHLIAFYMMAGPPHLARVRLYEVDSDRLAQEMRWVWDVATRTRTRYMQGDPALLSGKRYRAELGFSKPMRYRNADGFIVPIPGGTTIPRGVDVSLSFSSTQTIDTSQGEWRQDPARVLRYRDDTFAFEFNSPIISPTMPLFPGVLTVATRDFTGLALDANPVTPADWADGAWSAYESADGSAGDVGGADATTQFRVSLAGVAAAEVLASPAVVGEGDAARVRLRRVGPVDFDLYADTRAIYGAGGIGAEGARVHWAPGENDERTLRVPVDENVIVDGPRAASLQIVLGDARVPIDQSLPASPVTVLDNDGDDLVVARSGDGTLSMFDALWLTATGQTAPAAVVIDGGREVSIPARNTSSVMPGEWEAGSALAVYGNHATFLPARTDGGSNATFRVDAGRSLLLDGVDIEVRGLDRRPILRNAGTSRLRGFSYRQPTELAPSAPTMMTNAGALHLERASISGFRNDTSPFAQTSAGEFVVESSTIAGTSYLAGLWTSAGDLVLLGATIAGNGAYPLRGTSDIPALRAGHLLSQGNASPISPLPAPGSSMTCVRLVGQSLGFNLASDSSCGLTAPTDRTTMPIGLDRAGIDAALFPPVGIAIDTGATAANATATGCAPVDQRGTPRPQTLTTGAEPRCDIGAIELGVNPYRGIWAPARSGHGLDLQTSGNQLLLAWYTYADDGQPTAYQAAAPLTGPHWEAALKQARRDPATGAVTVADVGRVALDFASDTQAQLHWRFNARGIDGSEAVQALQFDTSTPGNGTPRVEVTGLWYAPQDSGYGATITRRGETTAIAVYYYDAAGALRWALGTGDGADALQIGMTSYTGFCPDCDPAQMPVTTHDAGTLRAHFRTPERARLDMALTYPGAAGGRWDRSNAAFVPLSDPVNNTCTVTPGACGLTQ